MANKKQREKRNKDNLLAARDDWDGMNKKHRRNVRRERRDIKRVLEA